MRRAEEYERKFSFGKGNFDGWYTVLAPTSIIACCLLVLAVFSERFYSGLLDDVSSLLFLMTLPLPYLIFLIYKGKCFIKAHYLGDEQYVVQLETKLRSSCENTNKAWARNRELQRELDELKREKYLNSITLGRLDDEA